MVRRENKFSVFIIVFEILEHLPYTSHVCKTREFKMIEYTYFTKLSQPFTSTSKLMKKVDTFKLANTWSKDLRFPESSLKLQGLLSIFARLWDSEIFSTFDTKHSEWQSRMGKWENLSYAICEQQRWRSACTSTQSDQRLCCSLPDSMISVDAMAEISRH